MKYLYKKINVFSAILLVIVILFGVHAFATPSSAATSTDEFADAKSLIDQGKSCQQLSLDQLDKIGDYYMEQMMPGQAHKNMEQILGGEGSDSLKQMHILMARRWYCGDAVGMGMMGMMMGPGFGQNAQTFGRGYGMMGGYGLGSSWNWGGWLLTVAGVVFFVVAIAALIKYLLKR